MTFPTFAKILKITRSLMIVKRRIDCGIQRKKSKGTSVIGFSLFIHAYQGSDPYISF